MIAGAPTPITLSHFSSERSGSYVDVDWGTSSELFNVGFQLWGLDGVDGDWEKLHNWYVRSGSGNAVEPQSYSKRVRIPGSIDQLMSVGLSSIDSDGSEHYYGPFEVGSSYGELSSLSPIDWGDVRAELDTRMGLQGYVRDGVKGYRQVTSGVESNDLDAQLVVEFQVSESGMYRISSGELLSAGIDWSGVGHRDIAVLDSRGESVVRYVRATGSGGWNKTLGTRGEVYFYGHGPDEGEKLYSDTRVYRLMVDPYRALEAPTQGKQGVTSGFSDSYVEYSEVELDNTYILNSALDDPWVDAVMVGYTDQPQLYGTLVPVESDALWDEGSRIHLRLGRSSGLPGIDGDGDGEVDAEHVVEGVSRQRI